MNTSDKIVLEESSNIVQGLDAYSQVVFQSRNTVAYTDATAKNLFKIPANADIIGITLNVTTLFNDSGTDLLSIGKTGTANFYRSAFDVSSAGQTVTGWSALGDVGASDVQVTATYTGQNGNSSGGAATIIFFWTRA
jgi:hypothetical protein